jgi:two-component system, cell cycle sensor histidine kinase and response regulator CckA
MIRKRHILLPLITFIFGYMLFSVHEEVKQKTIDDFNGQQMILAKQAAKGIENYFKNYFQALTYLASFDDVILANQRGKKIISDFYNINSSKLNAITLVSNEGKIIYTVPFNAKAIGANISQQSHVKTAIKTQKPVISDVFTAVQGYQAVAYYVPIIKNKIYLGNLAILIPFDKLVSENLTNIKIGKSGYGRVISQKGIELFCPIPGHVGKTVNENSSEFPGLLAMAKEMMQGKSGVAQYRDITIPGNKKSNSIKHAAYFPINLGNTFWSIVVATPENEVLSTMKGFRNKWLLIAIVIGLAVITYGYLAIRSWNVLREEETRKFADAALRKSEEKYRELAESSNSIILKFDQNWRFTFINKYAHEFFGFSEDEIIGQNAYGTIIPERDNGKHSFKVTIKEISNNPAAFANNENVNICKNGERVWVAWRNKVIYDDDGNISGLLCTGYDITERKRAEKILSEQTEKLDKAYQQLSQNINILNQAQVIAHIGYFDYELDKQKVYWADEIYRIVGKDPHSFTPDYDSFFELMLPEDRVKAEEIYIKSLQNKTVFSFEARIQIRDGSIKHIQTSGQNEFDPSGDPIRTVGMILDITEHKLAEERIKAAHDELEKKVEERTAALKRAKEEAECANIAKSEFLSNMSHEIRTPMHQILSFSKFGVSKFNKLKTEKRLYYFTKIGVIGQQLMSLLNNLLDLSKLESGKMDYEMFETDLKQVISNVSQEFHSIIKEKRIILVVDEIVIPTEVVCDEYKISQVIRNLLSNAIKYMPSDKKITISLKLGDFSNDPHLANTKIIPAVVISIKDEGVGIPKNELTTVFDKFIQSSKTKTGAGGTGLGLAISKEIVLAHNGKIWAENNPDGGSTFSFMLPAQLDVDQG